MICTKDGLVWIVEGASHIATVNQGRWRLLTGAYDDSGVGGRRATGIRRVCLRSAAGLTVSGAGRERQSLQRGCLRPVLALC